MILQALHAYYERKVRDPDPARRLPAAGLEDKEIPFILELAADGRLVGISDTRQPQGKKKLARRYLVPQGVKKTSGVAANLLWDTAEYVLGLDTKGKPERVAEQTAAFRQRIEALARHAEDDAGLEAVRRFLAGDPLAAAQGTPTWAAVTEEGNPYVSFRLQDDNDLVCQRPAVFAAIQAAAAPADAGDPQAGTPCLITGQLTQPERLHSAIKGVRGAQTSGANIVSFNLDAFRSFGKEQGANAPVSPAAAFAYTTALNHLLGKQSAQRLQVGDASTVFWAQSAEGKDMEDGFAALFDELPDDPDAHTAQVSALFNAVRSGRFDGATGEQRFYVLGLAPNAARIAIRFWHAEPMRDVARRIQAWFQDLEVARSPQDPPYPTLFNLLRAVALQRKADNVPPTLGGDVMRAILSGGPYPALWLNAAVQRCRAEQQVGYLRAAVIKACLTRSYRLSPQEAPGAMLDKDNPNAAYRLGRLFSVLEKIQEEANPGINTTIRERYYGAASSTPLAVFTTLLRLHNHHLAKMQNRGRAVNLEKLVAEITSGITDFPGHLNLPDQGRFALGYYHQRQDLFTKAEAPANAEAATSTTTGD